MFVYAAAEDRWTEGPPVPVAGGLDHCNVASLNGKLYLLGALRFGTAFVLGETWMFDPAADRWERVGQRPTPRGASGVAVVNGRIVVAGGVAGGVAVATVEAFDPESGAWSRLADMPTARDHLTAQSVSGKFYAIAGRNGERQIPATEEYDPESNIWRARAPIPVARGGLGSGAVHGKIVVFGGEGPSPRPEGTYADNHEYDPVSDRWRALTPMVTPRHGIQGVVLDNRIFVAAGGRRAGADFSDRHEVFHVVGEGAPRVDGAVRNAASFEAVVAPGMIASLFGDNLSFGLQAAVAGPLPERLNGVTVQVGGLPAPLFFVSPQQVNFLIPAGAAIGQSRVQLTNAGVLAGPYPLQIAAAAPGIFAFGQRGDGQGAILVAGTGLLARVTRDAFSRAPTPGEAVEIYGTGYGAGATVTIGGIEAQVLFSGPAPGFPGLAQLNAVVPRDVAVGTAISVRIRAGGVLSNIVTMGIAPAP